MADRTDSSFVNVCRVFGLGAQILVTMGLQREKAGRGSLAMYTQVSVDVHVPCRSRTLRKRNYRTRY